jgi:hypothetical protein
MDERQKRNRETAIILALLSVATLLVGALGNHWLVDPQGQSQFIGLRGVKACKDGMCDSMSNFQLVDEIEKDIDRVRARNATVRPQEQEAVPREPWHGFPVVGLLAMVSSLLAAAGMSIAAFVAVAGKRPEFRIMPTTVGLLGIAFAIVTGCLFIATKPSMVKDMAVGWTFWTYGAGCVLGLAAVFPLNRQIRPIDEELGAASATMSWGGSRDEVP